MQTLAYLTIDGDPTCEECFNRHDGGEECRTRRATLDDTCDICGVRFGLRSLGCRLMQRASCAPAFDQYKRLVAAGRRAIEAADKRPLVITYW